MTGYTTCEALGLLSKGFIFVYKSLDGKQFELNTEDSKWLPSGGLPASAADGVLEAV
jgi:hypothetical protein